MHQQESSFDLRHTSLRSEIERFIDVLVPANPSSLYDPVRHILSAGGKRVRPILTALAAQLGEGSADWLPAAAAVELLHTFTLVHDDIMDNAESRRGKPTTHVAFGSNAAILSGDVLIALAIEVLARSDTDRFERMLAEFGAAFRAVCEGQALDKEFEDRDEIGIADYLLMIDLKTSKILELAAVLGGLAGKLPDTMIQALRQFAHHAGLAFQIRDDLLDLTAQEAVFGKTIGGDILEGKRTYLFVSALRERDHMTEREQLLFDRIRSQRAVPSDIPLARELFMRLGILDAAERAAAEQTETARRMLLDTLPDSPARQHILAFGDALLGRNS